MFLALNLLSLCPACDDALEVAAFNASSWWHEVDMLGQDRTWVAERAALGTAGHSWATKPGTEAAWLELDLGTRRNVTGECCPQATLTTVLSMVTWVPASLTPPKTAQSSYNTQEELELLGPCLYWCKLGCRQCQPPSFPHSPFCPCTATPLIRSYFWKEQVNIMLLHLVPVHAFCLAGAAASRGFVWQWLVTAARKMGTLSGWRLEEGGMRGSQLGPEVIYSSRQSMGSDT